ncbi:hypothetical protein BJY26_003222 [Spelaeicoccus albus]|uniref:DUF4233 domain-containing protein n=2 Tax=Spelaeicoccus albus TaxID=1280376 RepID=A0A7Z0IIZ9_9MICO|nr:hypothetical protein [Spelaeicoccus albus]
MTDEQSRPDGAGADGTGTDGTGADGAGARGAEPQVRTKSTKRMFAAATLTFEIFVVFFGALVAFGLKLASVADIAIGGGAVVLLAIIAAALLRSRVGYVLGHLVQLCLIAAGFVVPMMFLVGALFAAAWVFGIVSGARVDREKAAYARALNDRIR